MNIKFTLLLCLFGFLINQIFAVNAGEQMFTLYNLRYAISKDFDEELSKVPLGDIPLYCDGDKNYMLHIVLNFEKQLVKEDEYTNPVINSFRDRIAKAALLIGKNCSIDIKNNVNKTPLDLFFDSIQTQKLIKPENLADFEKLFAVINSVLSTYGQETKDYFLSKSQEVLNVLSSSKPAKTSAGTGSVLSPIQIKIVELKNHLSKFKQKLENLKGELVLLKGALKKPSVI